MQHRKRDELGTVTEQSHQSITWNTRNFRNDSSRTEIGTKVEGAGDIRLSAGNDLNARGASVTSGQGAVGLDACRNISLSAAEANRTLEDAHQVTSRGFLSSRTVTTRDTLD